MLIAPSINKEGILTLLLQISFANNLKSEKDKIKEELDKKIVKLNDIEETIQEIINSNNIFNEYNDKIKQISQQKESELSQKI